MKKTSIVFLLFILTATYLKAQVIAFSSLKDFFVQRGDTLPSIQVEKRAKSQIMLSGGGDYKLSVSGDISISKKLKKRYLLVLVDSSLYVSCRKVRYKKLKFGACYAPAIQLNGSIYFSAIPLGTAVAASSTSATVTLGGTLGDAIAASGLISKRVFYEIDGITARVEFVSKQRMLHLLTPYPSLRSEFLLQNSESADITGSYLRQMVTLEH